jgi:hypothetical protein
VQTNGDTVDCTQFGAVCAADGDVDWCVRPSGDDACTHVYEDCGKKFATSTGDVPESSCNTGIVSQFLPCKLGCFATFPCDQASFSACFDTEETCSEPPAPPG